MIVATKTTGQISLLHVLPSSKAREAYYAKLFTCIYMPVIRAGNMDTTNNSEASGAAQNIIMSKKVLVVIGDLD